MPKPNYIAVAAISIDGYIAPLGKPGSDWTSPEDKQFLHEILDTADVVIVGHTTYGIARQPLAQRNCIILTRKIPKIKKVGKFSLCLNPKNIDLGNIIKQLGYKRIIILGGAQTYTYCLEKGLLDEIYLTIEPIILGIGLPMFASSTSISSRFKLAKASNLNANTILLHYKKIDS